ncbi:cell division protein FtsQ [Gordonia hirsuta DSM 44140 = NBRC 16056]|uniref:Cell division protein FtsQ n=1 Tax=Gordonia hirsuta DSM 44140 = NBRC 16056 TaxID=1121927 RepID=L7L535_9ACTN|nr:FtsQ-type POTRA domain-containing protein [Gordonia hirsuta]GAC55876.1 cell division protein FtsQ [Gordonia hirsuta DSM 44140 = NBRC 16056]
MTGQRTGRGDGLPVDPDYAELRRVGRRRLWRLLGVLVVLAVLGALAATAYYSSTLSVRTVTVQGRAVAGDDPAAEGVLAPSIPRAEILAVADVPLGKPLLQVDTAAIAERVARIPAVASVRVDRRYPSTLVIDVQERTPRAVLELDDGRLGVMDGTGVVYIEFSSREAMEKATAANPAYRDLPLLEVPNPGPGDPATRAVLKAAGELPPWLRPLVETISASSPADVKLGLTKGRTAVWGNADRGEQKAEALRHVLKLQGTVYNVSSPDYPAVS